VTPGQHRLAPSRRWDDWVNQRGDQRPPLIRPPRWLLRAWARLDHARYVHRNGHAGPSEGRTSAYHRVLAAGVVVDGERQTIRAVQP
jgi:hypothetical protein